MRKPERRAANFGHVRRNARTLGTIKGGDKRPGQSFLADLGKLLKESLARRDHRFALGGGLTPLRGTTAARPPLFFLFRARSVLSLSIYAISATWGSLSKVMNFGRKAMYILIIILVITTDFGGHCGAKLALKDRNELGIYNSLSRNFR